MQSLAGAGDVGGHGRKTGVHCTSSIVVRAAGEHDNPVESQRRADGFPHVRQAVEEIFVDGIAFPIELLLQRHIRLEAAALLGGVGEFAEGVGEFDAAGVKLEPLGDAGVVRAEARERRLAGGIIGEEGRPAEAEVGLDLLRQQAAEQVRPGIVRRDAHAGARRRRRGRRAGKGRRRHPLPPRGGGLGRGGAHPHPNPPRSRGRGRAALPRTNPPPRNAKTPRARSAARARRTGPPRGRENSAASSPPPPPPAAARRRYRASAPPGSAPTRYHSSIVNSGACRAVRSRLRNTRAKAKMRVSPAASSFFIANSGEVWR